MKKKQHLCQIYSLLKYLGYFLNSILRLLMWVIFFGLLFGPKLFFLGYSDFILTQFMFVVFVLSQNSQKPFLTLVLAWKQPNLGYFELWRFWCVDNKQFSTYFPLNEENRINYIYIINCFGETQFEKKDLWGIAQKYKKTLSSVNIKICLTIYWKNK